MKRDGGIALRLLSTTAFRVRRNTVVAAFRLREITGGTAERATS
jgi:hypothetical protein